MYMKSFLSIIGLLTLVGCSTPKKEDALEGLDKKSAREVTLTTVTKGDTVYHLTKQNIWLNGEKIAEKVDTVKTNLTQNTWSTNDSTPKLNEIPIYVTVQ